MYNPFEGVTNQQKIKLAEMIFGNTTIPLQLQTIRIDFNKSNFDLRVTAAILIQSDERSNQFETVSELAKIAFADHLFRANPEEEIR
jgi:uncharacterized protein YozE (UPF0346 family)